MTLIRIEMPILLYDNYCSVCYTMAKIAWKLSRKRIIVIGMYTKEADFIRHLINPKTYQTMSWLLYNNKIFGGRKIILPIIKEIIKGITKPGDHIFMDQKPKTCSSYLPCKGLKGLIFRLTLLLTRSYKIDQPLKTKFKTK